MCTASAARGRMSASEPPSPRRTLTRRRRQSSSLVLPASLQAELCCFSTATPPRQGSQPWVRTSYGPFLLRLASSLK